VTPRNCRDECRDDEVEVRGCLAESVAVLAPAHCPRPVIDFLTDPSGHLGRSHEYDKRNGNTNGGYYSNSNGNYNNNNNGAGAAIYTVGWFIAVVFVILPLIVICCIIGAIFLCMRHQNGGGAIVGPVV